MPDSPVPATHASRHVPIAKVVLALLVFPALHAGSAEPAQLEVDRVVPVAPVVADFRVGFNLLTSEDTQYVAFYNERRMMTVASRALTSTEWRFKELPSRVGWDSHNYVTMALDRQGHLHVTGNMHVDPLVYFRTTNPGDVDSLQKADMTGEAESRVTYPRFLTDRNGDLVFTYRDGGSGNGRNLWNRYDPEEREWSRFLEQPMFDGEGRRNAYPSMPVEGGDGWFHMTWVWRHTPDCATNHNLSYARSRDLRQWESASGERVSLPITVDDEVLLVDPVPSGGGLINGGHRLHVDPENGPTIAYHKRDSEGHMQIFAARPQGGGWKIVRLTRWDHPVEFSGHGSMGFIGIRIGSLDAFDSDALTLTYRHEKEGHGRLFIHRRTLEALDIDPVVPPLLPSGLDRLEGEFPGLRIRREWGDGSTRAGVRYLLQWESLGANRDRRPEGPVPEPSMLRLIRLSEHDRSR